MNESDKPVGAECSTTDASSAASESLPPPLAAAAKRLRKQAQVIRGASVSLPLGAAYSGKRTRGKSRRGTKMTRITPALEAGVSGMVAHGIAQRKVAKVYRISPETVRKIANENREYVQQLRDSIKNYALNRIEASQEDIWVWLNEVVQNKDSRAFDSLVRGLVGLEKIGASASGESSKHQSEHTIKTEGESLSEVQDLIGKLGLGGGGGSA